MVRLLCNCDRFTGTTNMCVYNFGYVDKEGKCCQNCNKFRDRIVGSGLKLRPENNFDRKLLVSYCLRLNLENSLKLRPD